MHCPFCGHEETKVTDSRHRGSGRADPASTRMSFLRRAVHHLRVRRAGHAADREIRTCGACPSMRPNCAAAWSRRWRKRPVSREAIDDSVTRICHKLRTMGEREVPSRVIGELVMEELHPPGRSRPTCASHRCTAASRMWTPSGTRSSDGASPPPVRRIVTSCRCCPVARRIPGRSHDAGRQLDRRRSTGDDAVPSSWHAMASTPPIPTRASAASW